jgi:RimJ/RimL family protein N-acetyltransferase
MPSSVIDNKHEPVFLRALDGGDLDRTHRWHNDQELYRSLVGGFRFVSRSAEEQWLRGKSSYSTGEVNLAICRADSREHIGNAYLRDIDWVARHAGFHLLIGEPFERGKGYGQSALRQVMKHARGDLGLQRLYLYVLPSNAPARHIYEKCGFVVEGNLRRHVYKEGHFQDLLVMGWCAEHAEK